MIRILGVSSCLAFGLAMAGCATDGAGGGSSNVAQSCGGQAYQQSFQGTVEYSPQGRSQVASLMGGLEDPARVDEDTQRRVANVVGADMVGLFMNNYQTCVQNAAS